MPATNVYSLAADRFPASSAAASPSAFRPALGHKQTGDDGVYIRFSASEEIFDVGSDARLFYKVVRGAVRTCRMLSDGRRYIDAFYVEGDIFGIDTGTIHHVVAEAVNDCTLLAYKRNRATEFAPHMAHQILSQLQLAIQSAERAQEHAFLLGQCSAEEKIAIFLLDLDDRGGQTGCLDLPMNRQDIADYLGLTIETVSRTLKKLERRGLLAIPASRHVQILNSAALRRIAGRA